MFCCLDTFPLYLINFVSPKAPGAQHTTPLLSPCINSRLTGSFSVCALTPTLMWLDDPCSKNTERNADA